MCANGGVPEALGIPLGTTEIACDRKKDSKAYIETMFPQVVRHFYDEMSELLDFSTAKCYLCRGQCCMTDPTDKDDGSDILVAGLPCQPFTRMRSHRRVTTANHQSFETVFTTFLEVLRRRKPKGFLVENVPAFLEEDPESGTTWCEKFAKACCKEGYSIRVFRLDASTWCEMPRDRRDRSNCRSDARSTQSFAPLVQCSNLSPHPSDPQSRNPGYDEPLL